MYQFVSWHKMSQEMVEDGEVCNVCQLDYQYDNAELKQCTICNMTVHERCFLLLDCWCASPGVCRNCLDGLPDCAYCNQSYCVACAPKSICEECDDDKCPACVPECEECGALLCMDNDCKKSRYKHERECATCEKRLCRHGCVRCADCSEFVCEECRRTEFITHDYYCDECFAGNEPG